MATTWDGIVAELRLEFPRVQIVPKGSSLLWRVLYAALLMRLWNPGFLTSYTTVLGSRIYMPERLIGTARGAEVLRHERVHLRDARRWGPLFQLSYVLLPIGPSFRALWELRAYRETMRAERDATGGVSDWTMFFLGEQFTGPAYLWMWPFPGHVRRLLERMRAKVLAEPWQA